jgi:hypothetical protein
MHKFNVGDRVVHEWASNGVGVVRAADDDGVAVKWPTHKLMGSCYHSCLRPAPDFPRVYLYLSGTRSVHLDAQTRLWVRQGGECVDPKSYSPTLPTAEFTGELREITGTHEAADPLRRATEWAAAEKAKDAPAPTPLPAPLPSPEEVAEKLTQEWDHDIASLAEPDCAIMKADIAAAFRAERARHPNAEAVAALVKAANDMLDYDNTAAWRSLRIALEAVEGSK